MSSHSDPEREDPAAADPANAKGKYLRVLSQRLSSLNRQMEILDYNTGIAAAKEEGEAKGRAEGRAEGRKEGRAEGIAESKSEVVTNMLNMGFDISSISKASGWPAEQILAFAREHSLPVKQ